MYTGGTVVCVKCHICRCDEYVVIQSRLFTHVCASCVTIFLFYILLFLFSQLSLLFYLSITWVQPKLYWHQIMLKFNVQSLRGLVVELYVFAAV